MTLPGNPRGARCTYGSQPTREAAVRAISVVAAVSIFLHATALIVRRWGVLAVSQAPQKAGATEKVG